VVVMRNLNQPAARFLQGVRRASTYDDARPFRSKSASTRKAQPFARARDNGDAILQSKVHG